MTARFVAAGSRICSADRPARRLAAHLLLAYDDVADLDGLIPFFRQIPNPHKRYVVVPNAGT
ncbi:MAG: hypothetical protein ACJ79V_06570 [Myxococcales bacterium]